MRKLKRLSAQFVATAAKPGLYHDGGGLWLQVTASRAGNSPARSWIFRYKRRARTHDMGLGPVHTVSLAEARRRASGCRLLLLDGVDPLEARRAERSRIRVEAARARTFRQDAEAYIAAHADGWKNDKHRAQWTNTLATYAHPVIGDLPVAAIDTALMLRVLEPIWRRKTETASRVRGRIEAVLDWASARGHRTGENPARWRGHLDKLLPRRSKVAPVKHHEALPYVELPTFMTDLRLQDGIGPRALEFTILTAARTGEAIGARRSEIDLTARAWTVPAERMKGGKEHTVPLSDRALEILETLPRTGDHVFEGARPGRPIGSMAMALTLRRMGRGDLTVHGFRSSFRDWAAEQTSHPNHVIEMALAHAIGDKVEAAYRRGDLFAKRRRLMADWARYCATPRPAGEVVALRGRT
jgi:integrase